MTPQKNRTNRASNTSRPSRPSARHTSTNRSRRAHAQAQRSSVLQDFLDKRAAKKAALPNPTMRDEAPSPLDQKAFVIPNSELVVTRRQVLYGAVGVGLLAAATTAAKALSGDDDELDVLAVSKGQVTDSTALTETSPESHMNLVGNFEIPYGSLVWCSDEAVACCLIPGESAKPLTQVKLLWLSSGNLTTVVKQAVSQDEGFEIYDARGTSQGLIWTEADILEGTWRVYTAVVGTDGVIGAATMVDQGDKEWETPTIAMVGSSAFWQVMPNPKGSQSKSRSAVKKAAAGSDQVQVAYTSRGRLATPPYATENGLVISPRTDTDTVHYQLTYLDAQTCDVLDSIVLPQSMKPIDAGYGDTGFSFCFEGIYDFGDGIANLGTYVPLTASSGTSHSSAPWLRWARTPVCAPAWCRGYLICKSTSAVCGVNPTDKTYFALDVETGSADYGDYLATTGSHNNLVTYANVDSKPVDGEAKKYCRVRVWRPL